MGIEERRQKLMLDKADWGAPPPASTRKPPINLPASTRADTTPSLISHYDNCASKLRDTTYTGMQDTPHDRYRCVHISTRDWSLHDLIDKSSNFHAVPRVAQYSHRLAETVKDHEATGKPLIIEKWEKHMNWDKASFMVEHFVENTNDSIAVRNVHDWTDKVIPLTDFIRKSRNAAPFASPNESERLYGKDALCPPRWSKWLQRGKTLPESLLPEGPDDLLRYRPKNEPIETLMCYLGIGDTFTPCHKDLCASSGHNLMVYTEDNGSSYWFMTESSSAPEAEKYFNSLEEILDHETHVITVEQLAKAPFKIYIAEQKLGDLVLVPPRSCHQVVNYGGITIKTSWSRMTLKGLETALYHELPLYRRVCRQETYRVKDTTYHALIKLTKELEESLEARRRQSRESLVSASEISNDALVSEHVPNAKAFRKLLESVLFLIGLYRSILMEDFPLENVSSDFADVPQRCDFCGADIFQTYFVCQSECQSDGENCVICSGCYAEGRSCKCEDMEPMQCRIFSELLAVHGEAVKTYNTAIQEGVCIEMKKIPSGLPPGKHPQIFQAAMILYNIRKQRPQTKVCSFPKGEPKHVVQFHSALSCRKCHAGKCFAHLLSDHRIHAVQALLLSKLNDNSREYHETHQKGKERFDEAVAQILKSQKEGVKPRDGNMLLVHNALTFGICKPINPACTKKGWYDIVVQVINPTPIADDWLSDSTSRFASLSPLLEASPIRTTSARKSARVKNLPYVLVPVAHYLRSRMRNVQKDRHPNGEEVVNTSPVVKRKQRKSTSDSRHSIQFSTSNPHEATTSRSGDALTDRSDVSPTGKPHPVGALPRKRKREELARSRPVQHTPVVIPQRHKSLEEALNGAGSINGRLPTESDEDIINKLKDRTQKVRTPSSLGVKRRLPKSPKQSKAKASGREPGISSKSTDVVPEDDVVVDEATRAKRNRSGPSRRKDSSRAPAAKPRRTVSYDEVVQVRLTRQRDSMEQENLDMMEGVTQFGDEPIYNEAEDLAERTMDAAPPEDSSPSQPSRPDFDERDSPTTSIPSPAHVPSRLRKRPRFQGVAENVESPVSPVLRRNSDSNSVQQNHIQDQPQRKRSDEQPALQINAPQVLPDLHAQTHVVQMTASQIMEFTQAITRQTVEEMTNTMLRGLILQTPAAADQAPKEAPSQTHARVGQETESEDTAPARTHGMDLKATIKDAIREILNDSAFTQQSANVAPPPTSNIMAAYPSAVPNNGYFASQHTGQMQYPQMQMHGRYDGNSAYLRYDNSVSMASRPGDGGESSRYHQNIQRPHAPSRHSYPSVRPQHYPSRSGLRSRNPTFGGTGTLQRAQWDRPYDERTSSSKATSNRHHPYETRRTTRSSTRRQEASRSDRSAESPVRESGCNQEYAPLPSSTGSPREKQAPAAETRTTRSTTLASSSNHEHQQQRREARTPPWESHPSRRNSEERTTTRKSNEERSANRRASTDAVRDPQDWEYEYAQDDHPRGDTRTGEPSSSKPDSMKTRHKLLTDQMQVNPWE